jgi:hypothetical protein
MCQKRPKGVITDGNTAMIKSIGEVFMGVWHRVCSWHIDKNMKKHLPHDVLNQFKTLLYYTTTEAIFEVRWRAFVQKWQTDTTTKWMERMYKKEESVGCRISCGWIFSWNEEQPEVREFKLMSTPSPGLSNVTGGFDCSL